MNFSLLLDVAIIVLLIPTILFALRLNRGLSLLRDSKSDLARMIGAFNEATLRAESSIPKLRQAADMTGKQLKELIDRAQALRDDLAYMSEKADGLIAGLDGGIKKNASSGGMPMSKTLPGTGSSSSLSSSEPRRKPQAKPETRPGAVASSIPSSENRGKREEDYSLDDDRSEAERELLKALRSIRG